MTIKKVDPNEDSNDGYRLDNDQYDQLEYERKEIIKRERGKLYELIRTQKPHEHVTIIENITEDILNRYRFVTIEETREILYYNEGVYCKGGGSNNRNYCRRFVWLQGIKQTSSRD